MPSITFLTQRDQTLDENVDGTIIPSVFKKNTSFVNCTSCGPHVTRWEGMYRVRSDSKSCSVTGPVDTLSPQDGNRSSFGNIVFFFWTRRNVQILSLRGLKPTFTRFKTNPKSAVDPIAKTRPLAATPLTLSTSSSKLSWRSSKRVFITTYLFPPDLFSTWNYCITFTLLCSKLQFEILLLLVGW